MDERAQQQLQQIYQVRETMIRQEMIFKEQVRELHRLYQKQKLLMAAAIKQPKLPPPPPSAAAALPHHPPPTRDFLNILNKNKNSTRQEHDDYRASKRRKMFDLEQLPDDTEEDAEEEADEQRRRRMNSLTSSVSQVLDFRENQNHHHRVQLQQQGLWNDRHTLQEMPLFPIPNRVASSTSATGTGVPAVATSTATTSTVGGVGSNGGLDTKNGILQQPLRWVNQNFGRPTDAPQQSYNLAAWKDLIGAQQAAADRSQNYHQRHLAVPSYNSLTPEASAACLQFNNVLATLRPQQKTYASPIWQQQMSAPYTTYSSYFTQEPSTSAFTGFKNGFTLDPNHRNPASDNSRNSCFSGISTAATQQPVRKPPVPIFEKTEDFSLRKFAAVSADPLRERDQRSAIVAERENDKGGGSDVNADAARGANDADKQAEQKSSMIMREDEKIRHPEGSSPKCHPSVDKVAVSSDRLAESVGGTTRASCTAITGAADSPSLKASQTLVVAVSANNTAGTQEREEECLDGSSACLAVNNESPIISAATILLSLAPDDDELEEVDERCDVHHELRSCAGKRHSVVQESSSANLLSDVKLFKSVVIMLKQSGAAKPSSKKVVVASSKSFGKASNNVINGSKTTLLRTMGMGQTDREQEEDQSASKPKTPGRRESLHSNDSAVVTNSSNTMIKKKAAAATTTRITTKSSWIWGEVTRRKRMQRQRHHAFGSKVQVQS